MTQKIIVTTISILYAFCVFCQPNGSNVFKGIYNIKDFGAIGDGVKLDSKAINKAIDAAAAGGGGMVYVPSGNYLSGSIHLKSNISLYLEQGSFLIAAPVSAENEYDEEEQSMNTTY